MISIQLSPSYRDRKSGVLEMDLFALSAWLLPWNGSEDVGDKRHSVKHSAQ